MARNALEAVFGALGGGLVGYGKDKNLRLDREEERLARELAARQSADQRQIGLASAGYDEEGTLRQRPATVRAAGMAAQAIPMSGTIGSALDVASQQMGSNIDRGRRVTLSDGRTYVQPFDRTPEGREERAGMDRAARRTEGREDAVFESGLAIERDAAGVRARQSGDERADRIDRTRRAAAEYLQQSKGRIVPGLFGGPSTVQPYTPDELKELRRAVYGEYGLNPDGSNLTVGAGSEAVLRRQRDEAIAAVEARLRSAEQKTRAKQRIEDAYQADLAKLGTPR